MGDLVHLLEYISIDVLLIGVIFLLFLALSWSILKHSQYGVCRGISKAFDYIAEPAQNPAGPRPDSAGRPTSLSGGKPERDDRRGKRGRSWLHLAVLVVLASQVGTVLVRLSDEVLDSDAINAPFFLYVPAIGDIFDCNEWGENWQEEDLLKLRVIRDGMRRADFVPTITELLRRHVPPPEGSCYPPRDEDDCAKGFFQHANAVVLGDRGSDDQRDELRHEKYTVYLLSVLFVGTWILILTTFVSFLIAAWKVIESRCIAVQKAIPEGQPAAALKGRRAVLTPLATAIAALLFLWCAEGFILRLWTEQSVRYNRRLLHAYVDIASYGDPAMGIGNGETQDGPPEE